MTYPTTPAVMKHDLGSSKPLPPVNGNEGLLSEFGFSSSTELFRALEEDSGATSNTISSVYSYSDAPDFPGPLSRALSVLGVADVSLR